MDPSPLLSRPRVVATIGEALLPALVFAEAATNRRCRWCREILSDRSRARLRKDILRMFEIGRFGPDQKQINLLSWRNMPGASARARAEPAPGSSGQQAQVIGSRPAATDEVICY